MKERALRGLTAVEVVDRKGGFHRLRTPDPDAALGAIVDLTRSRKRKIRELRTVGPSLVDAFVALTGGDA